MWRTCSGGEERRGEETNQQPLPWNMSKAPAAGTMAQQLHSSASAIPSLSPSAITPNHPSNTNYTLSLGRECSECRNKLAKNFYSATQWNKAANHRKCLQCAATAKLNDNNVANKISSKNNDKKLRRVDVPVQAQQEGKAILGDLPALIVDDENSQDDGEWRKEE
jgi:hypothetical protein